MTAGQNMKDNTSEFSHPFTAFVLMTTEDSKRIYFTLKLFVQHSAPMSCLAQWTCSSLSLYPDGS